MRPFLLALVLASSSAYAAPEPVDKAPKTKPTEGDKFPIPKDATGGEGVGGGGGKIFMYKVGRGRDAVAKEVRASLKTGGWTVTKDTTSPSGNAIRLEVKKSDKLYKVSFTGDDKQTAIILTLP